MIAIAFTAPVDPFATKMALRDGVTTGMDLEFGALHVKDWYDKRAKTGWQVNYGTTASHNGARTKLLDPETNINEPVDFSNAQPYIKKALAESKAGWSVTRSTTDQMNAIMKILDEDLRAGAPVGPHDDGLTQTGSQEVFDIRNIDRPREAGDFHPRIAKPEGLLSRAI